MPNPRCPLRGVPHVARQALPPLSPIHVPTSLPCAPLPCPEPCRDTNASDNVHKVFLQHVKDGTRPAYLRRPKPWSRASSGAGAGAGGSTPAAGAGTTGPGALGFHLKGDGWGSMQYHARCMARAAMPHRGSPVPRVTISPPPHTHPSPRDPRQQRQVAPSAARPPSNLPRHQPRHRPAPPHAKSAATHLPQPVPVPTAQPVCLGSRGKSFPPFQPPLCHACIAV